MSPKATETETTVRQDWSPLVEGWLLTKYEKGDAASKLDQTKLLEQAISYVETNDYSTITSLLAPLVKEILKTACTTGITPFQRSVLTLCFWADAELAAQEKHWGLAIDLLLASMEVSHGGVSFFPMPLRATQFAAAEFLGSRALESEPSELAKMASPAMLRCLALVVGRACVANENLTAELLGSRGDGLYFSVRESALNLLQEAGLLRVVGRGRDRDAEYYAFRRVAQLISEFRRGAVTVRDLICNSSGDVLQRHVNDFLRHVGRHKFLLLPQEISAWKQLEALLGGLLTRHINSMKSKQTTTPGEFEVRRRYADDLWRSADHATWTGLVGGSLFRPIALYISSLSRQSLEDASKRQKPALQLRRSRPRYPLEAERELSLRIEVMNVGQGPAADVILEATEAPAEVIISSPRISIGPLSAGESKTCSVQLSVLSPLPMLRLALVFSCIDWTGSTVKFSDEIVVGSQSGDPNWEDLLSKRPYSLEPVEDPGRLRGRSAHLNKLLVNINTLTSSVVWGQKRVGKTSVARVVFNQIHSKADILAIYVRRGDVAGYDEGGFARHVAERIISEAKRKGIINVEIQAPRVEEFGAHIAHLTRVVDDLRSHGLQDSIVLFFDEFDEFNPGFFRGPRGDNFFATLRSLTERRTVLVLIGSERMPAIFRRYDQQLNKFDTLPIDTINEMSDVLDMIEKPVAGYLEYDREASAMLAELAGQNPYYVNLLCMRILQAMVHARRIFIDVAEVTRAAQEIATDHASTHWGHLWEENEVEEQDERAKREIDTAVVLSAFGQRGDGSLNVPDIVTTLKTEWEEQLLKEINVPLTLDRLVGRKVLHLDTDPPRYDTTVKLFRWWLFENTRTVLISTYKDRSITRPTSEPLVSPGPAAIRLPDFPLLDEDLVTIAEGLWYRSRPVDAMQIKNWLRQFQDEARILLMFRLLEEFRRRWYYDETRIGIAIEKAYDRALTLAKNAGVTFKFVRSGRSRRPEFTLFKAEYLKDEEIRGVVANVYVSYFGDKLKSGAQIARRIKKERRLGNVGDLAQGLQWLDSAAGIVAKEQRFLMIVDDLAASGYQFRTKALPLLRETSATESVTKALLEGRIVYIPLWAYRQGIEAINEDCRELRVEPVYPLDESDQVFSDQAGVFDEDERPMAEAICRHIGQQLFPDNPLGWENLQAMVVFYDSVPNASLPILWCSGIVDERPWKPLFPR